MLVLASASPRRLQLLKQIGLTPDQVVPANIDETPLQAEKARDYALRMAIEKARAISTLYPDVFILAADTVVAVGRRILPKTETQEEARAWLNLLSGRRHHVYGGIALITPDGRMLSRCADTTIQFKTLTEDEITAYIASNEWRGVAGGYAIQGYAACFIKSLRGSYSNVVGLCLYDTMKMMTGAGVFNSQS